MALLIALQPLLLLLLWIFPSQATDSVLSGSCGRPDLNVPNVNMSVITKNSFKVGDRLRLTCDNGYVRKAGTSNLIHCEANQFQWSKPNLTCIRLSGHPPLTTTPTTEAPKAVTPTDNDTTENASPMYNIKVKAVAGGSAAVIIVIGGGLFLLWLFVVKRKVCRLTSRASKYEMEPVEPNSPESGTVAEVELVNETKALQSGEHRDSEMIQTRQVHPLLGWCGGSA
ncbi:interleukin-15 receptor subunit alpha isoform X4 [Callorhinchus milii]|uniref:interleukin-15 receptor subunit alpha isoform X4 n=1 Tax=Callorhinchus milii TaxID=7868 RepID=UPI0004573DA1|nr:interleukin-15 receptor subunit alpha isoform X4 [Callorhinchus milii]|eukprot:gi/632947377/ref/XP_007889018.1/ PREDICTED: interleukin-15 receptor subunit alpha isoform X4 [Callorhinchus milii]